MVKKKTLIPPARGSTFVSPELVVVGQAYSLTINPENQRFGEPDRFILITDAVYKHIKGIPNITVCLYPEISQGGRVHFHGTLIIHDIIDFYLFGNTNLNQLGHIEMDTIADMEKWMTYCKKSDHYMDVICAPNRYYLVKLLDDAWSMNIYDGYKRTE